MTLIAEKTYTPQEFSNDSSLEGYELVNGHPRERAVSEESSRIGAEICRILGNEARKNKDATVYGSDMGYDCFPSSENTLRFADVSLIRASRKSEISNNPGYMPIPADLVVEVLSPNDRIKDIDQKIEDYLKAGFGLIWIVSPRWRHVQVYRPDGSVQLLSERDEITGETALPGFRCRVGEFFDV